MRSGRVVELVVRTGDASVLHVAWVEVLPFSHLIPPDVVVWGARTFVYDGLLPNGIYRFREARASFSHTEPPGVPEPSP